jgi:hypothetical protein
VDSDQGLNAGEIACVATFVEIEHLGIALGQQAASRVVREGMGWVMAQAPASTGSRSAPPLG